MKKGEMSIGYIIAIVLGLAAILLVYLVYTRGIEGGANSIISILLGLD